MAMSASTPSNTTRTSRALCLALVIGAALVAGRQLAGQALGDRLARADADRARVAAVAKPAELSPLARAGLARLLRSPSAPRAAEPTVQVTGVVLDPDGAPIPGATVELDARGNLLAPVHPVTSDADGRFAIPAALPYGGHLDGSIRARHGALVGSAAVSIAIPGDVGDLEIALAPALAIRGEVTVGGRPAIGARVRAIKLASRPDEDAPESRAVAGEGGRFELAGFGPGAYRVEAAVGALREHGPIVQLIDGAPDAEVSLALPDVGESQVTARRRDGGALAGVRVRDEGDQLLAVTDGDGVARFLAPRDRASFVQLDLAGHTTQWLDVPPGGAVATFDRLATVSGQVTAETAGVVLVEARAVAPHGGDAMLRAGATVRAALDRPGRFELALWPGLYEVTADVSGAGAITRRIEILDDRPVDLGHLAVAGPVGALAGTVIGPDGAALSGARLSIAPATGLRGGSFSLIADEGGRFAVPRLPAGRYRVDVWSGLDGSHDDAFEVAAGRTTDLALTTRRRGEDDEVTPPAWQPAFDYEWSERGLVVLGSDAPGGLLPGDLVITIGGHSVDAGQALEGGHRSRVRLGVLRPATGTRFEVTLSRDAPAYEEGC